MEAFDKITDKCNHQFNVHEIESDNVIFKNFVCKKCKYSFVKKIQKENISFPELEKFSKYLNKPFNRTLLNDEVINSSLNVIKKFIRDRKIRGLVFHDKRGTGKTHLAVKLMKIFKSKFHKSIYALNFSDFVLKRYRDINLSKNGSGIGNSFEIEDEALESDVLLLDEVGKGSMTDYVNGLLYTFIDNVYMNEGKFLIITTNLSPAELEEYIDEAVVSRLYEICEFISFNHIEDYRKL